MSIHVSNQSITSVALGRDMTVSEARFKLDSNKRAYASVTQSGGAYTDLGRWADSGDSAADFECRMVLQSGSFTTGSTEWQSCSKDRVWTVKQVGPGAKTASAKLQIRRASDDAVMDTAEIELTAQVVGL